MTALLPQGSTDEVRAFANVRVPAAAPAHPLEAESALLRAELDETRAKIADSERDHERAVEVAREEGRLQGRAQAETREAERLIALEATLQNALQTFDRKLVGLDRLAAELAGVALERLFDERDAMRMRSTDFIARQVQELKGARIILARVSAEDFGDEASLAALGARLRNAGAAVEIVPDPALQSGQAWLGLTLGCVELDLAAQGQALAAMLCDMAQG